MKKKQYILFAALLFGSAAALGVAQQAPFNAQIISNSRTIKEAGSTEEEGSLELGTKVDDIECLISSINIQETNAKLGLQFAAKNIGTPEVPDYHRYGITYLASDEKQDVSTLEYLAPKLEVPVEITDPTTGDVTQSVMYAEIKKGNKLETLKYDIIGAKEFALEKISTYAIIEDFNQATTKVLTEGFKVLNLYDVKLNEQNLYELDSTSGKFQRHYCDALTSENTTIVQLSNYVKFRFKGYSEFNGVGSIQFDVKNMIEPTPEEFYKQRIKKVINKAIANKEKAKAKMDEIVAIYGEKEAKKRSDYKQAKIDFESYEGQTKKYILYQDRVNKKEFDIRTTLKFDSNSQLKINYKDGTSTNIRLGDAAEDLTDGEATLTFYSPKLLGHNVASVVPSKFKVVQRLFNHTRDKDGRLINSYVDPKDGELNPAVEFNEIKLDVNYYANKAYDINVNEVILYTTLGCMALYELISVVTFFILKNKNKDDLFKKVRPKQYWSTNTMGLLTTTILLLAIMSICFRWTTLDNTFKVTNSIDILVVTFSIASIIFVGYFIRYFAIQIKNIRDKRRNEKMKLNSNTIDDGTVLIRSTEGDK